MWHALCQKWFSSFSALMLWLRPLLWRRRLILFLPDLVLELGQLTRNMASVMKLRAVVLRNFGRGHQNMFSSFDLVPVLLRVFAKEIGQ